MTTFKPMLAKDGDLSKVTYPAAVQPKLDGIRACVVEGKLLSRTLKPIPNAEIRFALERPEFEGFDGEIIVGPATAEDCYRRTASFVMAPNKTGEPWCFHVFDKWDEPGAFWQRYGEAEKWLYGPDGPRGPLAMVPTENVRDSSELEAFEARAVSAGHEGIIVRSITTPYKFGRSGKTGPLLKVKRFIDFEAVVVGVYEQMHNANEATRNALGRTERSTKKEGMVPTGMLGGLVLQALNGPAAGVEFECGTGFKRDERVALWRLHRLNGRVAKIKSFPIGVKDKPRFPVFLGWRDTEVDG